MINYEALFKISYGLYIVSSGDSNKGNGFISNTLFQVTAEPPQFAACCNKNNYTSEFIERSNAFSVSVLQQDASTEIIGKFGYKSGKDIDKLEDAEIKYGETGVPVVLNESIAWMECKVLQKIDVGTHWMFIGELVSAEILNDAPEPLTYAHYRIAKKGMAPKNAPTYIDKSKLIKTPSREVKDKYRCSVCGYVYDEGEEDANFSELPNDWTCPVCGAEKEDFVRV